MESFGGTEVQSGNSFTALLELSPNQATELLHSAGAGNEFPPEIAGNVQNHISYAHTLNCSVPFPSNAELIERAAKYSVFASGGVATTCFGGGGRCCSPETRSFPFSKNGRKMKSEPAGNISNPNFVSQVSDPTVSCQNKETAKRKEREKKGKGSVRNSKSGVMENGEKLPYIHVRARRGQATDSHSLAERARREKINARMKILQELVPGCNKISSTTMVLDQIIKHVQNLQCQVEYLSMKVAAVDPRIDFDLDSLLAAGNGSLMGDNFQNMMMPLTWPIIQMNGGGEVGQQQWTHQSLTQPDWVAEEDQCNLLTPENSLLSYDSRNSASMQPS